MHPRRSRNKRSKNRNRVKQPATTTTHAGNLQPKDRGPHATKDAGASTTQPLRTEPTRIFYQTAESLNVHVVTGKKSDGHRGQLL